MREQICNDAKAAVTLSEKIDGYGVIELSKSPRKTEIIELVS